MELKIEYLPVESLKPYKNNARKHGDEDIDAICESIKEFGFDDPIGIWRDTIVEGHGRLMAAKKLGMTEVPCIRLDHLTDEQRKAYALAHNRTAELSAWDFEMRDIEIESLDIDMTRFGFEIEDTFDETDLDNTDEKTNVVASINCGSYSQYDAIKDRLQELADEIGGTLAVRME